MECLVIVLLQSYNKTIASARDVYNLYWNSLEFIAGKEKKVRFCLVIASEGVVCGNRTPRGTITAPLPEGSCHVVTKGWEVDTRD